MACILNLARENRIMFGTKRDRVVRNLVYYVTKNFVIYTGHLVLF